MFIKKLTLKNFQKHSNLTLDFNEGVNVLYGTSDAGKSCIRRAIEWCLFNENIDGIRKTGTKKTVVTVILDNDVEIERVRSISINRYILRKEGKESQFDAIGRSIPDEIKEEIGINPIEVDGEEIYLNSQPQISLPFLFDKSPSFRMRLFNKLTGNDVLDKLFGQFNKDILRIKRNAKKETERFESREKELKEKEIEKEKAEVIYRRLKKRVDKVKKLYENYRKLVELNELRLKNIKNRLDVNTALDNIKIPEDIDFKGLTEKIDYFNELQNLKNRREKLSVSLGRVRTDLQKIVVPALNMPEIQGKIKRLDTLISLKSDIDKKRKICYTTQRNIKINNKDLSILLNEQKHRLKEMKICPVCKQTITDKCLKEIEN